MLPYDTIEAKTAFSTIEILLDKKRLFFHVTNYESSASDHEFEIEIKERKIRDRNMKA